MLNHEPIRKPWVVVLQCDAQRVHNDDQHHDGPEPGALRPGDVPVFEEAASPAQLKEPEGEAHTRCGCHEDMVMGFLKTNGGEEVQEPCEHNDHVQPIPSDGPKRVAAEKGTPVQDRLQAQLDDVEHEEAVRKEQSLMGAQHAQDQRNDVQDDHHAREYTPSLCRGIEATRVLVVAPPDRPLPTWSTPPPPLPLSGATRRPGPPTPPACRPKTSSPRRTDRTSPRRPSANAPPPPSAC
mmetsp:Transcript_91907/g.297270  ORF Transcript_91907/g.297270 Transcript_91907/m.297270 type:complete len:238 (+) Transcript_91907:433-1146(+)